MKKFPLLFRRENVVEAVAIIVALAVVVPWLAFHWLSPKNAGFGEDWVCTRAPNSEPVCLKLPAQAPADSAESN